MKGLSDDLEFAIGNAIDILGFVVDIEKVDSDKLESLMKSKADSFLYTKELILTWQNSINSPSDSKLKKYISTLIKAGESSILDLRLALRKEIDPSKVDAENLGKAIKAKPILYKAIAELDSGIIQLKLQLEADNIDLKSREFTRGYPEKFANQEFYPEKNYYKEWYDEENDAIIIDPKRTKGEIITLDGLKIWLPQPPKNKKEILFSKLPEEEQYWRRIEPPKGLSPTTENEYSDYILEEFKRRREGVWFMNKGKPIWLCPAHYMGLQHNKMLDSGGYKDFRWAQCLMYYFTLACIVDTRCVGELFVKGRRTGFSEEIIDYLVNDSTSMKNSLMGMTSKTGDDAQEAFLKYSYVIQNLPFYFQPVVKGKIDDRNKMEFGKVSENTREAKKKKDTSTDEYLNTKVDWLTSTTLAYDSKKLKRYLCDEAGKRVKPQNIIDHWNNVKPTMVTGGKVVGKCFMGSTLNPRELGGEEFISLYYGSDVTKRNANGRTSTGLYSFFLPAHKNMEDYTDKYGYCHEVLKQGEYFYNNSGEKKTIGSLQFLENEFASAKKMGTKVYNNTRRLDPVTIEDAFRDELQSQLFDVEKINDQVAYNRSNNIEQTLVSGNFHWKDGVKFTEVIWKPCDNGRFLLSWIPEPEHRNKWIEKSVFGYKTKSPVNIIQGSLASDPYDKDSVVDSKLVSTEQGVQQSLGSRGAIHGVLGFNISNAPSNYFFLEYICRPKDAETFYEDALMACIFYSMPILIENNKQMMLDYFFRNGYRGYSTTRFDKDINRLSADEKKYGGMPNSSQNMINAHWTALESYINKYVGKYEVTDGETPIREVGEIGSMPFNKTLYDWLRFDPKKRTDYDASISSGLAIMAVNQFLYKPKEEKRTQVLRFKQYR
jgi:hypothetical protein